MSNVVSLADARRRAVVPSMVEDARRMIEVSGRSAGLIVSMCARRPDVPDAERAYWVALAEEIARIEGYSWYVPEPGEEQMTE